MEKSGEKLEKVGKSGPFQIHTDLNSFSKFWMSENNFRSQFLPFQIDKQLFLFLKYFDKMAAGGHFGLDDNVSYRTYRTTMSVIEVMVWGELGRFPVEFTINCRMLGFWHKLRNGNNNKISCILYKMLYNMHMNNYYSDEWILKVQNILN